MGRSREYIEEFGDVTTLHGVRYITRPNVHWCERVFWILAIVICTVGCGIAISTLYEEWKKAPSIAIKTSETLSRVNDIPYPAITICPSTKILSHYETKLREIHEKLTNEIDVSEGENILFEAAVHYLDCPEFYNIDTSTNEFTQKHVEAIYKMAPDFEDVFENCYVYEDIDCRKVFQRTLTMDGVCFIFNIIPYEELYNGNLDTDRFVTNSIIEKSNWIPERGYNRNIPVMNFPYTYGYGSSKPAFVLKFDVQNNNRAPCNIWTVRLGRNSASIKTYNHYKVKMHSPIEFPLENSKNLIELFPNTKGHIIVTPEITEADESLKAYNIIFRHCLFSSEIKTYSYFFLKYYTSANCIYIASFGHDLLKNCSMFHSPMKGIKKQSIAYCRKDELREIYMYYAGITALCLPNCNSYNYKYDVRMSSFPPTNDTFQLSSIAMDFENLFYRKKIRVEVNTWMDFLANIGGLLGLFTGFSAISVIEIIYFLSLRLFCKIKKKNNSLKPQVDEEEPKEPSKVV